MSVWTTYLEADSNSLPKPFRMTACESFVNLPTLLTKFQSEVRQSTG